MVGQIESDTAIAVEIIADRCALTWKIRSRALSTWEESSSRYDVD